MPLYPPPTAPTNLHSPGAIGDVTPGTVGATTVLIGAAELLKNSSGTLLVRNAADNAAAPVGCGSITLGGAIVDGAGGSNTIVLNNGTFDFPNYGNGIVLAAGTNLRFVGVSAASPMLKRSGTTLAVCLADDSGDAPLTALSVATTSGFDLGSTIADGNFVSTIRSGKISFIDGAGATIMQLQTGGLQFNSPNIWTPGYASDFNFNNGAVYLRANGQVACASVVIGGGTAITKVLKGSINLAGGTPTVAAGSYLVVNVTITGCAAGDVVTFTTEGSAQLIGGIVLAEVAVNADTVKLSYLNTDLVMAHDLAGTVDIQVTKFT